MQPQHNFPEGLAVVIGGSGGIGRAIALALAKEGTHVALTYQNNMAAANQTIDAIKAIGRQAWAFALTAQDTEQVIATLSHIRQLAPIHTLVNAAGASIPMQWISQIQPAEWAQIINSDVNGVYNIVHAALPYLRETKGSFVQISSAGLRRYPTRDVLSVAPKAAIEALVQGIAREEGRFGVRANSIGVGVIEAGMFLRLKDNYFNSEWLEAAKNNAALKRFGTAEEVANVAVFLASQRASYVTGQFIAVDGGYTI